MASLRLLRPFSIGVAASCIAATPLLLRPQGLRPLLCDSVTSSPVSPKDWSFSQYERDARTPVVSRGRVNPRVWRQVSTGSILGLVGGLAVSVFSKPLALVIGLLVFGVQFIESRGIHIIPYNSIQRYFKKIDLRSAVQDNVAFKLSFGATFALAGFAEF